MYCVPRGPDVSDGRSMDRSAVVSRDDQGQTAEIRDYTLDGCVYVETADVVSTHPSVPDSVVVILHVGGVMYPLGEYSGGLTSG